MVYWFVAPLVFAVLSVNLDPVDSIITNEMQQSMVFCQWRPPFGELNTCIEMVQKGGFAKYPARGSDLTPDNEFTATELQWPSLHHVCSD